LLCVSSAEHHHLHLLPVLLHQHAQNLVPNLQQSSSADNIKHNKFCYNNLPNAIPGVPIVAKKINSFQFKSTEVVKPA
jgi:hypothetical protein